jgi:hypothetical protein
LLLLKAVLLLISILLLLKTLKILKGFTTCLAQGVYRNAANAIVPILRAGVWLQVQPISSVQLTITAGGFTAGTVLVYGVN